MKNGAVSYVTRNTAPFFYKAFATIKSIYSLYCKPPVNHVFSATPSISIFVPKNKIYDDTRRSCRNYYVLQGTQSNL